MIIRSSWSEPQSAPGLVFAYRASPSLVAKNIINLILVLTIWWCPCVESIFHLVGRQCLLWPVHSLDKTLLAFALLHFVLQGQTCLLLQVSLNFLHWHSSLLWWKGHLFWLLVLEGFIGLHRTVQLQLLQHYWSGARLGLLWYWMVCLENRDHSVIFEIASKYCISHSFVDYDGYSISSKGFLPTVVNIIAIWGKFTHSGPFSFTDSYNVHVHSCHLLFDHFQFTLIHGPNIPGSYAILFLTASDFTSITSHIHTWVLFCFGSISSFFLELFLHWSPVAYWAPTDLGSSSFSVLSFCLFILFMGFSRQE